MSTILLPLDFPHLEDLEKQQADFIEQAVKLAISQSTNLVILVTCKEIEQHANSIDTIWEKIQGLLGKIYVIQLNTAYKLEKPLFDCNVVFGDVCSYPVHLEPYIRTVCVVPQDASIDLNVWNKERLQHGLSELEGISLESNSTDDKHQHHSGKLSAEEPIEPLVFRRVAVGGTFDHMHAGHRILLTMTALLASSSMVVGVTDDCMLLKKKYRDLIVPIEQRLKDIKSYMQLVKRDIAYDIVPIQDPFGPTVTDPTIDALVVSKETLEGGHLVNEKRKMLEYPPLELRIIDVISSDNSSVQSKDMNVLKISSSWIREYLAEKIAAGANIVKE